MVILCCIWCQGNIRGILPGLHIYWEVFKSRNNLIFLNSICCCWKSGYRSSHQLFHLNHSTGATLFKLFQFIYFTCTFSKDFHHLKYLTWTTSLLFQLNWFTYTISELPHNKLSLQHQLDPPYLDCSVFSNSSINATYLRFTLISVWAELGKLSHSLNMFSFVLFFYIWSFVIFPGPPSPLNTWFGS